MGTIKRFEEIKVWQEARALAKMVYDVTSQGGFAKDFGLKDQIQRAAVSVGSNIAEGFARNGNKEFVKFLWIAKGSATEVQSQLYAAMDIGYIADEEFKTIYDKAESCNVLIYRFIKSLRGSEYSGERYKRVVRDV
jgi:four helix bundle protein